MRAVNQASIAVVVTLLAACSQLARIPFIPPPSTRPTPPPAAPAPAPQLDAYKRDVARHIIAANPDKTFSGALPPMLPAIVVVNLSIDADGRLTKALVQRSRDSEASEVALACVRRAAPYPKPAGLLRAGAGALEFSETFLFNDDYRFQLRTVAGPQ